MYTIHPKDAYNHKKKLSQLTPSAAAAAACFFLFHSVHVQTKAPSALIHNATTANIQRRYDPFALHLMIDLKVRLLRQNG